MLPLLAAESDRALKRLTHAPMIASPAPRGGTYELARILGGVASPPIPDPVRFGGVAARALVAAVLAAIGYLFFRRGMGGGDRPKADRAFEEHLWSIAREIVARAGLFFEPDVDGPLRQLIGASVARLGPPTKRLDPNTVRQVESAFTMLLDETTNLANSRGSQSITWPTIQEVLKRICPVWPIC